MTWRGRINTNPPVSPITSHGFCITKSNAFRVLEVIYILVIIYFPPSDYMARSSSVGAHGWHNVSFYNHLGWSFMLSIWRTGSSSRYLLHPMLYHKIDPGVGFMRCLSTFGDIPIAITVTPASVPRLASNTKTHFWWWCRTSGTIFLSRLTSLSNLSNIWSIFLGQGGVQVVLPKLSWWITIVQ